jgi:hypothetical protein
MLMRIMDKTHAARSGPASSISSNASERVLKSHDTAELDQAVERSFSILVSILTAGSMRDSPEDSRAVTRKCL